MGININGNKSVKSQTARLMLIIFTILVAIIVLSGLYRKWNIESPIISIKPAENDMKQIDTIRVMVPYGTVPKTDTIKGHKVQRQVVKSVLPRDSNQVIDKNSSKASIEITDPVFNGPTQIGSHNTMNNK